MKDAVDGFLKAMGIDKKVHEASVLNQWEEMMGTAVASRTEKKMIKDRVLILEINSSVMREELLQSKGKIIQKINEAAGFEMIEDVYLK
jgi:predicted nucleic acid-binding Zn ribbon protein